MYYIFDSKIMGYRNGYVQAKMLNPPDWDTYVRYRLATPLQSMIGEYPRLQFEVRADVPHPDNYWTGSDHFLFSGRLLSLLQKVGGIHFETFEVDIYERKSKRRILEDYRLFRIMDTCPLIDYELSEFASEGHRPRKFVVNEQVKQNAPHIFIEEKNRLIFISEELKHLLDEHKITGCQYKTIDDYVAGFKMVDEIAEVGRTKNETR